MKPVLSQVCTLNSSFETDIEGYAASNCRSIETWFTKLEYFLARRSIEQLGELLAEHNTSIEVASFQGGLFTNQVDARDVAWDLFEQRLQLCSDLSVKTVVVAFDVLPPITQADVELASEQLRKAANVAGLRGLRLAIEPQSRAAFGNNVQTMVALLAEIGSPHLGICLDLHHFYLGPSKFSDLSYLSNDNLFHVQLSDLADVPREFASDSDRIVPGDGDFDVSSVVRFLKQIEYTGCISMELMNPQIWQVSSRQFSEIGMTALNQLLE